MIADIDMKIRKVVRKTCAERKKISLLKDVKIRKYFDEKIIELVDIRAPNVSGHFNDGVLETFHSSTGSPNIQWVSFIH